MREAIAKIMEIKLMKKGIKKRDGLESFSPA